MNKKAKIWGLEFELVFLPKLSQNARETPICLKTQPTFKAILAHFDIGRSTLATRNVRPLRQPSWKTCKTYVRKTGWGDVYVAINKMNKNIIYTLWQFNIAIENGPVEIVNFPIETGGSFHSYVIVYQRVNPCSSSFEPDILNQGSKPGNGGALLHVILGDI